MAIVITKKKLKKKLSDTRYSAGVKANAKFHHFSGVSIDIGE